MRSQVVEELLRLGANPDSPAYPDRNRIPAAWIAAERGHTSVLEALARRRADVNLPDCYGFTPLSMAAHNGRIAAVQALLRLGADAGLADARGVTPADRAEQRGHTAAAEALARHSCHPPKRPRPADEQCGAGCGSR